jgi:hypothetical protein
MNFDQFKSLVTKIIPIKELEHFEVDRDTEYTYTASIGTLNAPSKLLVDSIRETTIRYGIYLRFFSSESDRGLQVQQFLKQTGLDVMPNTGLLLWHHSQHKDAFKTCVEFFDRVLKYVVSEGPSNENCHPEVAESMQVLQVLDQLSKSELGQTTSSFLPTTATIERVFENYFDLHEVRRQTYIDFLLKQERPR